MIHRKHKKMCVCVCVTNHDAKETGNDKSRAANVTESRKDEKKKNVIVQFLLLLCTSTTTTTTIF
jgi:hypothetical protein